VAQMGAGRGRARGCWEARSACGETGPGWAGMPLGTRGHGFFEGVCGRHERTRTADLYRVNQPDLSFSTTYRTPMASEVPVSSTSLRSSVLHNVSCFRLLSCHLFRFPPFTRAVSRVFRTFDLPSYSGRLLGLGLFCCWTAWGPRAKRLGDGHDFSQPVHLQIAFGSPLVRGHMA
jgi:hypothetical protein